MVSAFLRRFSNRLNFGNIYNRNGIGFKAPSRHAPFFSDYNAFGGKKNLSSEISCLASLIRGAGMERISSRRDLEVSEAKRRSLRPRLSLASLTSLREIRAAKFPKQRKNVYSA